MMSKILCYVSILLEQFSRDFASIDKIESRRLFTMSNMYRYWAKKAWFLKCNFDFNYELKPFNYDRPVDLFLEITDLMKINISKAIEKPITQEDMFVLIGINDMVKSTGKLFRHIFVEDQKFEGIICSRCGKSIDTGTKDNPIEVKTCPSCKATKENFCGLWEL